MVAYIYGARAGTGCDPHTAAPIAAYVLAAANSKSTADLLFLAAGAGPIAATSLYRRQLPSPSTESR